MQLHEEAFPSCLPTLHLCDRLYAFLYPIHLALLFISFLSHALPSNVQTFTSLDDVLYHLLIQCAGRIAAARIVLSLDAQWHCRRARTGSNMFKSAPNVGFTSARVLRVHLLHIYKIKAYHSIKHPTLLRAPVAQRIFPSMICT